MKAALTAQAGLARQVMKLEFTTGELAVAFAANQRDEVRDLRNVAGTLSAQPGMKQQTFVAGFSAGAGASAGSIAYSEQIAPTLKGSASGNCMPSILCLNDQGGSVMDCSEDVTGTLAGLRSTDTSRLSLTTTARIPAFVDLWTVPRLYPPALGRVATISPLSTKTTVSTPGTPGRTPWCPHCLPAPVPAGITCP